MTTILTESLAETTARDVMRAPITACGPETELASMASTMAEQRIHSIVVEGISHEAAGDRLVWAVASDLDVVRAAIAGNRPTAAEVSSAPVLCVDAGDDLLVVAVALLENEASHAIVTDDDRPVGIVSSFDVLGALGRAEAEAERR